MIRAIRVVGVLSLCVAGLGLPAGLQALSLPSLPSLNDAWGYLFAVKTRAVYPLQGESLILGRSSRADIMMAEPHISRRHAEIRLKNGAVELVDLGSTNGTRLNAKGLAPDQPARLTPGDLIYLASEPLLFHRDQAELWKDALQHVLLGQIVRLKIPVGQDRESKAFGNTRIIDALTRAKVDLEAGKVGLELNDSSEPRPVEGGFIEGEAAFVGQAAMSEGALSLSLWGWERGGATVSRRASFSKLKHGELQVSLAGTSPDSRARFEEQWGSQGLGFLSTLLGPVLETVGSDEADVVSRQFARELVERPGLPAARDATNTLAFRHRLDGADPEFPALAARGRARWVKSAASERRAVLTEPERGELRAALAEGREWARRAAELGAKDKVLAGLEAEIQAAEKVLEPRP